MPPPNSPRSLLSRTALALPDAVSAGAFLLLWIAPFALGPDGVRNALLLMLVEFVLVHASGMLGGFLATHTGGRRRQLLAVLGFGLFYAVFVAAFAFIFQAWWPVLALLWLLGAKLGRLFSVLHSEQAHAQRIADWGLQALVYILGVFATLFLPLPRLGLSADIQPQLGLPGSGIWVDEPHRVIAFGALYFGLLAWSKWKDWSVPAQAAKSST
jgi:hypothetical protein